MQWRNDKERYGAVARLFHWGIAALILAQYPLGIYGARLPPGFEQLVVLARHKSIGISVFVLAGLRLAWRRADPPPPLPPGMRRWQRRAAGASHALLYLLLFGLPVSGWLFSSASGVSVSWFGLVALPDLVAPSRSLAHVLLRVHVAMAVLMGLVLVLHAGAALWHHFSRRDPVLVRMLPGRARNRSARR
ncbi:MAG TPA: cytochrome b [Gammaproteobacteria bacterium]|nr:cytochrome b [Gammaproteobacteria bacterium]